MDQHKFKDAVARDYVRNFRFITLFDVTWAVGMGFAVFAVMMPSYLTVVKAPKTLIGFIQAGFTIFAFVQIFSSHYCCGFNRKRNSILMFLSACFFLLVPNVLCLLWPGTPPAAVSIWFFSLLICGFVIFISAGNSVYAEIITDVIPRERRGKLFGFRMTFTGLIGLLFSYPAAQVMAAVPAPTNYYLCFMIGAMVYLCSCFSALGIRDHVNPAHTRGLEDKFLADIKHTGVTVLGDPNYRIFIFFYICSLLAGSIGSAYIIPFARDVMQTSQAQIDFLMKIVFLTFIAFSLIMGLLADRCGYRLMGIIINLLQLAGLIAIIVHPTVKILYAAYASLCLFSLCGNTLMINMSVELCENIKPAKLVTIGSLLPLPFVLAIITGCGQIIDYSNNYLAVFIIAATLGAVSLMGFLTIVREPRKGNLYYIKPVRQV